MAYKRSRTQGTVTSWNDDRGYGFIVPDIGNYRAFFHISAFNSAGRPADGDVVTYFAYTDKQGREAANDVQTTAHTAPRPRDPASRHAPRGNAAGVGTLAPVVLLIAAYFVADQIWFLPKWLPWLYMGASVITFLAYAFDKAQARKHRQRVSEATLLLLGLAGGWPGAIIAQLVFRHKTLKRSFRVPFWITVEVNVVAIVTIVWLLVA